MLFWDQKRLHATIKSVFIYFYKNPYKGGTIDYSEENNHTNVIRFYLHAIISFSVFCTPYIVPHFRLPENKVNAVH